MFTFGLKASIGSKPVYIPTGGCGFIIKDTRQAIQINGVATALTIGSTAEVIILQKADEVRLSEVNGA